MQEDFQAADAGRLPDFTPVMMIDPPCRWWEGGPNAKPTGQKGIHYGGSGLSVAKDASGIRIAWKEAWRTSRSRSVIDETVFWMD